MRNLMERLLIKELEDWKNSSRRKPLLLTGGRLTLSEIFLRKGFTVTIIFMWI